MKYLFSAFSFIVCLLFATDAYAEDAVEIKANHEGQVIVDEKLSKDDKTYILNEAIPNETYSVTQQSATTFAAYHYSNGFFDDPRNVGKYTANFEISNLIDNDLNTSLTISGTKKLTITFQDPVVVKSIYGNISGDYAFKMYSNNLANFNGFLPLTYYNVNNLIVDKIEIYTSATRAKKLTELELFVQRKVVYESVANLNVTNIKANTAVANWSKLDNPDFAYNQILLDGQIVETNVSANNYMLKNLEPETEYEVTVRSYYTDGKYVDAVQKFTTAKDTTPPGDVTNLQIKKVSSRKVELTYDFPLDNDFEYVRIYRDNLLIKNNYTQQSFTDENLVENATYVYRVVAVDKWHNASKGISKSIKILPEEVNSLTAIAKAADVVDLSWKNPEIDDFDMVKIYRKDNSNEGLIARARSMLLNVDNYTPLFETNGTKFKDLTVKADTEYTYKVTSFINAVESDGTTVNVKTPKVKVAGVTVEEDPTSYTIRWTSPKTGELKVLIAGNEYKIVNAADLKITIPAADMRFDIFGNYDVQLIPIDESGGAIGEPSKPGNTILTNLGFDAKSLMHVVTALLAFIGLILLLAMSFRVTPKLIDLIKNSFR